MNQRMPSDSQAQAAQDVAAQAAAELGLVLTAKQGDRAAFGKLAQQYHANVRRWPCGSLAIRTTRWNWCRTPW